MLAFRDVIVSPYRPEADVLAPRPKYEQFLLRDHSVSSKMAPTINRLPRESLYEVPLSEDSGLVRLPSIAESKWKVLVLQRWVGRVERIEDDNFVAVLSDATNPTNAPEEVELDSVEVSPSDLPLLVVGAIFYWAIGYCDTPGGQRERVSTLRFARLPRLSQSRINKVFEKADRVAALLDGE
ncbi:MAG: hypothetical protein SGI92_01830 [Bryobacteraceae bacterium]|nr:hypothetical protein [Bryobacteraceae bacterium]